MVDCFDTLVEAFKLCKQLFLLELELEFRLIDDFVDVYSVIFLRVALDGCFVVVNLDDARLISIDVHVVDPCLKTFSCIFAVLMQRLLNVTSVHYGNFLLSLLDNLVVHLFDKFRSAHCQRFSGFEGSVEEFGAFTCNTRVVIYYIELAFS